MAALCYQPICRIGSKMVVVEAPLVRPPFSGDLDLVPTEAVVLVKRASFAAMPTDVGSFGVIMGN